MLQYRDEWSVRSTAGFWGSIITWVFVTIVWAVSCLDVMTPTQNITFLGWACAASSVLFVMIMLIGMMITDYRQRYLHDTPWIGMDNGRIAFYTFAGVLKVCNTAVCFFYAGRGEMWISRTHGIEGDTTERWARRLLLLVTLIGTWICLIARAVLLRTAFRRRGLLISGGY
jgi:hypothetical protein